MISKSLIERSRSVLNDTSVLGDLTFASGKGITSVGDITMQAGSAFTAVAGSGLVRSATLTVAANDATALAKAQADYVCDGTDDQVQIQAAIDALSAVGGTVLLSEGTFTVDAATEFYVGGAKYSILLDQSNMRLLGSVGTTIKLKDGVTAGTGVVATIVVSGSNVEISGIYFDNNDANVTYANANCAIWTGGPGIEPNNVSVHHNTFYNGHYEIYGDGNGTYWDISHNYFVPASAKGGAAFHNGPSYSKFTNNCILNSGYIGIGFFLDSSSYNIIANNYIRRPNGKGISIYDTATSYNIISGNVIENYAGTKSAVQGIRVARKDAANYPSYNKIVGNYISNVGVGVYIGESVVGTEVVDNSFSSTVSTAISDSGTGTVIQRNYGHVASGDTVTISKSIDHAALIDGTDTTAYVDFDDEIPAGSIIQAVKVDYTEAFNSDDTTTLTLQIGDNGGTDPDQFNKTENGENAFNTTTDVFWGEASCRNPVVTAATTPRLLFTEDDDGTDIISGANAQGAVTVTITYMKA